MDCQRRLEVQKERQGLANRPLVSNTIPELDKVESQVLEDFKHTVSFMRVKCAHIKVLG